MRLKRIAMYRATRILSWVLPVVILVFISIAVWSYRARTRDGQPLVRTTEELPPDLAVRTEGVKYSASDGPRNLFEVEASRMLGFKDNRSVLEDVAVLIHAQKTGEPDRRIHGDECTHDRGTNQVVCNRNVSVELEPGTIALTDELSYDPSSSLISSRVQTTLNREGEMSGTSGKMEYFAGTGLMRLTNNFDIQLVRGGRMRGGIAVFQYKENWVTVSQGVQLTSANAQIRGGSGRADLLPGTYRPKKIIVEGGAAAEAPSFTVNSDWIESDLSDTGNIEHVIGRGHVQAERRVPRSGTTGATGDGDSLNGTLTGPEVEAWLENGILKTVEATGKPEFVGSAGTLRASERIRIEPAGGKAGSLRTAGASNFERDGLTIDGRDFIIAMRNDNPEQVFSTAARATLKAAGLKTTADVTEAHFDTKTRTLSSMEQSGNVTFEEDKGGRTGTSGKLTVSDAGNRIEMEAGNPHVTDAQGTLYSRKITLDRRRESFTGDGNVRMTSAGSGATPVVIYAGHVESQLGGENPRVDYTGGAEMYPGDGSKVDAGRLTAFPKEKRFEAETNVHSNRGTEQHIQADRLEFRETGENQQSAHYTGNVFASGYFGSEKPGRQKTDRKVFLELRARDLDIHSQDGDLDRIVAVGAVDLTQGNRKGHGDRLEYNATTGEILLMGTKSSEAEISEGDQFFRGCAIQIAADGSKTAEACADGSVTSSFKIKN